MADRPPLSGDAATWSREQREEATRVIPDFGEKLDAFAAGLSPPERERLGRILFQAMAPLDRMRWANNADLLTEKEREVLRSLSELKDE